MLTQAEGFVKIDDAKDTKTKNKEDNASKSNAKKSRFRFGKKR